MNVYKQSALLLKRLSKDLDSELMWFGKLSTHSNKKESHCDSMHNLRRKRLSIISGCIGSNSEG